LSAGGSLIYVDDELSGRRFLIDTGASVSILPHRFSLLPTGPCLVGADGKDIPAWGHRNLKLRFGGREYEFQFLLAAVSTPILGVDFLAWHRLLVDPHRRCVLDATSLASLSRSSAAATSPFVASLSDCSPEVRRLLAAYPVIVASPGRPTFSSSHGVEHVIETTGRPVFAKARRLDPTKLCLAKQEFAQLEKDGVIRRSSSPWSSPLHMVPKRDGGWRPCGDYRRLNLATTFDRYPLPNIQDFTNNLHGCTVFSTLDLMKGYHQIPVADDDVCKTAIITPFGLFEYIRMPFGLKNAAQSFQRLMDRILGAMPYAFVYLDDILVASTSMDEHLRHLNVIFSVLAQNGLVLNVTKCHFAKAEVDYLGHRVASGGIRPLPRHISAIQDFPTPSTVRGLQRFLGMVNFYRRFLPGIAGIVRPLTDALRGNPRRLLWSSTLGAAFVATKKAMAAAVPLAAPAPGSIVSLATDASGSHVGGVLQQLVGGAWAPLAFFSHKLSGAESRYSAFDRELLAAYLGIRHFRFFLEGREFHLLTDHKPLTQALHRVSPPWSARQQRQLSYIAEFTSDIRHLPGRQNSVADSLSRPVDSLTAAMAATPLDFAALAAAQTDCPSVEDIRKSPSLRIVSVPVADGFLLGDTSTSVFRPLVPIHFRRAVFDHLHEAAHPGARASRRLISSRFVWPGLARDVSTWSRQCLECQKSKITRHTQLAPAAVPVPHRRFAHIHVDLVGPLPPSDNFTHLLTIVDRSTRWFEAVPLRSTTAADCAAALFFAWISRFGVPAQITSDRGVQFTSALWSSLCERLHIQHSLTTAYHPESNGMLERIHRRLKDALRARATGPSWVADLPWVLLHLRAAPREDTGLSPAEALYGSPLVLPGQFLEAPEDPSPKFFADLRSSIAASNPAPARHNVSEKERQPSVLPSSLLQAEFVLVRRDSVRPPLSPLYDGPYKVLQRSQHFFKIQMGERSDNVSVHRLKAAYMPASAVPALPPRRGRPPGQRRPPPMQRKSVRFRLQPASSPSAPPAPASGSATSGPLPSTPSLRPSGRPARTIRIPAKYSL